MASAALADVFARYHAACRGVPCARELPLAAVADLAALAEAVQPTVPPLATPSPMFHRRGLPVSSTANANGYIDGNDSVAQVFSYSGPNTLRHEILVHDLGAGQAVHLGLVPPGLFPDDTADLDVSDLGAVLLLEDHSLVIIEASIAGAIRFVPMLPITDPIERALARPMCVVPPEPFVEPLPPLRRRLAIHPFHSRLDTQSASDDESTDESGDACARSARNPRGRPRNRRNRP